MSFQDSAVIFFIALLLFGPKKLPELARQLGKLMGEFRRASNEFRMQMEDELRISEQAERQKQIAALEAAAPSQPVAAEPAAPDNSYEELAPHPHAGLSHAVVETSTSEIPTSSATSSEIPEHSIAAPIPASSAEPTPVISTAGDLSMMPPVSGLPIGRTDSGVARAFESVPEREEPTHETTPHLDSLPAPENAHHG